MIDIGGGHVLPAQVEGRYREVVFAAGWLVLDAHFILLGGFRLERGAVEAVAGGQLERLAVAHIGEQAHVEAVAERGASGGGLVGDHLVAAEDAVGAVLACPVVAYAKGSDPVVEVQLVLQVQPDLAVVAGGGQQRGIARSVDGYAAYRVVDVDRRRVAVLHVLVAVAAQVVGPQQHFMAYRAGAEVGQQLVVQGVVVTFVVTQLVITGQGVAIDHATVAEQLVLVTVHVAVTEVLPEAEGVVEAVAQLVTQVVHF